ncbi:molybdopterin synthase catalytic subunit [Psychromicrobium silvestre]|uniref:Molybdopterin synthase catalytic subunit n=1 Tax=Psychromicrobium silvestre TaxID=1645614 RepID=A0A7Y9S977_9MICC|nr:molybdenum cofactor biosynthesis protein MoaE [Psychromicrobium silvestre]NYE96726.1 molybdopterin synthase catalytic subunit [Psychromicrobium silvestre]
MSIESHAALAAEPISLDRALQAVEAADCGAVVGFSGVVRNHDGGKDVSSLSYTAHPSAETVLTALLEEIVAEYAPEDGRLRIWAEHRLGDLKIGDPALVCAVAAAHRGLAFEVCSTLVDRIKAQVPIWKEQFFTDGTVEWVGI